MSLNDKPAGRFTILGCDLLAAVYLGVFLFDTLFRRIWSEPASGMFGFFMLGMYTFTWRTAIARTIGYRRRACILAAWSLLLAGGACWLMLAWWDSLNLDLHLIQGAIPGVLAIGVVIFVPMIVYRLVTPATPEGQWPDYGQGDGPKDRCPECGYPTEGLTSGRCPECGRHFREDDGG